MRSRVNRQMTFRKSHSKREITQFIVDPDAPELTLDVKLWYRIARWSWVLLNVLATLLSCGALVWLSYPQYIDTDNSININFLTITEMLCVLFFTIDYIIRIIFTNLPRVKFVLDAANIIDVLTTVPYYLQLLLASAGVGATSVFRVFFVFRMIRIIRLGKYHRGLQIIFNTLRYSADMLLLFVCVVLLSIVILATGLFYAERTDFDSERQLWYRRCPDHPYPAVGYPQGIEYNCTSQPAAYQSIPEAMYWAVVVMTTVGHSVETPTTDLGKAIAAVTAVMGLFYFAAPATVLATNYKFFRKKEEDRIAQRKIDKRAFLAMKAQEGLRHDLDRIYRTKDNSGLVKIEPKRTLDEVTTFEFRGVRRAIYEVVADTYYVYQPLVYFVRNPDGSLQYTDDFNMTTAQRVVTLHLTVDCDEARQVARAALVDAGFISPTQEENHTLVCADPECTIHINHDTFCAYPDLSRVVYIDVLDDSRESSSDRIRVNFCVDMPHMYSTQEVLELLRETRLHIVLAMKSQTYEMHVPLHVVNIMASKFIRELYSIAYTRKSDDSSIAYIHPHDAAQLLEGFSERFIPTPAPNLLMLSPHLVDQQVFNCLMTSFPLVKLEWLPPEAANAYYRSMHLNVDLAEEMLLEINLTNLAEFDKLGYGNRFVVQCPIGEEERHDVYFPIV